MSDDNEMREDGGGGGSSPVPIFIVLGVLFFPAVIVAFCLYGMLRVGKQQKSVVNLVAIIILAFAGVLGIVLNPINNVVNYFGGVYGYGNFMALLPFYTVINLIIGAIGGMILTSLEVKNMEANPHRFQIEGNWMYGFEYKPTPWEKAKRKSIIRDLKEGKLHDSEKAPLGVTMEGEPLPVFRYNSEARTHSIITGASGSGKPLFGDTLIPTPNGFIKIKDLKEGDYVFDENGKPTIVEAVFHPKINQAFEMTFRNGERIISGDEHLWSVNDLSVRNKRIYIDSIVNKEILDQLQRSMSSCDENEIVKINDLKKEYPTLVRFMRYENFPKPIARQLSIDKIKNILLLNRKKSYSKEYIYKAMNFLNNFHNRQITQKEFYSNVPDKQTLNVCRYSYITNSGVYKKEALEKLYLSASTYYNNSISEKILSSEQIFNMFNNGVKFSINHVTSPVEYTKNSLPIEPYTFGAWLGDGISKNPSICGADREIINEIKNFYHVKEKERKELKDFWDWKIVEINNKILKEIGVYGNKHIPDIYKYSSPDDRIRLIGGLIDTDGAVSKNGTVTLSLSSERLLNDAFELVSSLGWKTNQIRIKNERLSIFGNKEYISKKQYYFSFIPYSTDFLKVSRKKERLNGGIRKQEKFNHYIKDIKAINNVDKDNFYCITVSNESHLFLVGKTYIPTRNTISLQSLILNDIIAGIPVILIDLKRSPEFASKLAAWTEKYNGTFYHFVNGSPEDYDVAKSPGQAYYDVLKGSPTTKSDMMLGLRDWDTASEVYRANMQQLLTVIFAMLHYADRDKTKNIKWEQGGIKQLESALDINNFTELVIACEGTPIEKDATDVLEGLRGKSQLSIALTEMQGQVRTIASSEYGQWLTSAEDALNIDLFKLTRKPGTVILFSINSDSEPKFAKLIGSMIMSDLTNVSARRRNKQIKNQVNIYVDEFQALNASSVSSILEKSRESAMSMTLAQQSFEQVVASSSEAHLLSILDTCSNFLIHAGSTEDSALRLSKILGKKDVTVYTASNKNDSSFLKRNKKNRQSQNIVTSTQEKWIVSPKEFMSLRSPRPHQNDFLTTAILINKSVADPHYSNHSGALARKVEMIPDSEILETYYMPNFKDEEEHEEPETIEFDGDEVDEFIDEDDNNSPVPNNIDYLALKKNNVGDSSNVVKLDKEDNDEGGFSWAYDGDEVGEENSYPTEVPPAQRGLAAFNANRAKESSISNNKPTPPPVKRRESSFEKITQSKRSEAIEEKTSKSNTKKTPTPITNKPATINFGGATASEKSNNVQEEFTLPPMDELF